MRRNATGLAVCPRSHGSPPSGPARNAAFDLENTFACREIEYQIRHGFAHGVPVTHACAQSPERHPRVERMRRVMRVEHTGEPLRFPRRGTPEHQPLAGLKYVLARSPDDVPDPIGGDA